MDMQQLSCLEDVEASMRYMTLCEVMTNHIPRRDIACRHSKQHAAPIPHTPRYLSSSAFALQLRLWAQPCLTQQISIGCPTD